MIKSKVQTPVVQDSLFRGVPPKVFSEKAEAAAKRRAMDRKNTQARVRRARKANR